MGKVDCFEIPGRKVWFNSNDHLPPHFHVEKEDDWEIVVRFRRSRDEMIKIKWGKGPGGAEARRITKLAQEHREQLLEEWEKKALPTTKGSEK